MMIGTQTFGLAKELDSNFYGTLDTLHSIGIDAVEPCVLFKQRQETQMRNVWALDTLAEAQSYLDKLGMIIPSVHIFTAPGGPHLSLETLAENIRTIHKKTGITAFIFSGMFCADQQMLSWANALQELSNAVHPYGCTVVYHNHDDEFHASQEDGRILLDKFFDLLDENVMLQLDVGWAGMAGDEVAALKKYADRILSLHFKDFYPQFRNGSYNREHAPTELFAPVGAGGIRTEEIVKLRGILPRFNGSLIIDQDQYSGSMLDALKIGCQNLHAFAGGSADE